MSRKKELLIKAVAKFGTPTFVYDSSVLQSCYSNLREALPPCVDIFYALKVNPNLSLVKILSALGSNAEVCSLAELEVAMKAGVKPENIIFLGPCKKSYEIKRALEVGVFSIVVESETELQRISDMAGEMGIIAPVAIRINPNFSASGSPWKMGGRPTHFGIEENRVIEQFGEYVKLPNLNVKGIHVYNGTKILQAQSVFDNCQYILSLYEKISKRYNLTFSMVDVGGGLGIPYFENETELDMVELKQLLEPLFSDFNKKYPNTRIIMESGRFIAGKSGTFLVEVDNIKINHGKKFVVTDGGTNCHSSAVGSGQVIKRNFPIQNLSENINAEFQEYHVSGPLCNPDDLLGRNVMISEINEGDILAITSSGAYGPTASPVLFHSHGYPAEVVMAGENFFLARARDTAESILATHNNVDVDLLVGSENNNLNFEFQESSDFIVTEVIDSLRKALSISEEKDVNINSHLRDDLGLDSLSSMELLVYLEDKIPDFFVNPDTIEARNFNTVSTLSDYVKSSIESIKTYS